KSTLEVSGIGTSDDILDELHLRGYPSVTFGVRSAAVLGLDYQFPLLRIFRGSGTNPVFLKDLTGFVFGETTLLPATSSGTLALPSAGYGAKLFVDLFIHLPLVVTLEF